MMPIVKVNSPARLAPRWKPARSNGVMPVAAIKIAAMAISMRTLGGPLSGGNKARAESLCNLAYRSLLWKTAAGYFCADNYAWREKGNRERELHCKIPNSPVGAKPIVVTICLTSASSNAPAIIEN